MNKNEKVIITLSVEEYTILLQDIGMVTSQKYLFDDNGRFDLLIQIKKILINKKKTKKL